MFLPFDFISVFFLFVVLVDEAAGCHLGKVPEVLPKEYSACR